MSGEGLKLSFPMPNDALSENGAKGMHWGARRRRLDPWKEGAYGAWLAQRLVVRRAHADQPTNVRVTIPFAKNRRRDPSNYVGTVVKAIVDGLVAAGAWPDDDPTWVTVIEPTINVGGTQVLIHLEPRSNDA